MSSSEHRTGGEDYGRARGVARASRFLPLQLVARPESLRQPRGEQSKSAAARPEAGETGGYSEDPRYS